MQRLIKVVLSTPDDKDTKDDLLHLSRSMSRTLHEIDVGKRSSWEVKGHFPAPDARWLLIAGFALGNKKMFERALLEPSTSRTYTDFTCIGGAMFRFDLPVTHDA